MTSPNPRSSSGQGSQTGNNETNIDIDPQLDEDGFPTNEEFLRQQFSLTDLNREFVTLQEEYQNFLQLIQDPSTRAQVLANFDQQLQQGRPQFPTAPGQPMPYGQQGDYSQALQQFTQGVNPPDGSLYQAANQIPPEVLAMGLLQTLSEYLPPQY